MILISLLALSAIQASAAPSTCAQALEQVHARYFTEIEGLKSSEWDVRYGGYGIGTIGVGCAFKAIACGATLGVIFAGSKIYQQRLVSRIQKLEDGYKLFEVYDHILAGELEDESVRSLVTTLNAAPSQEQLIFQQFTRLVDGGDICGGGDHVQKSWDEVVTQLRQGAG